MPTRANVYWLTLEPLTLANEAVPTAPLGRVMFNNHDELFDIIDKLRTQALFSGPQQAIERVLGLKLFSEVLRHQQHPLFAEFGPAFRAFMGQLKSWPAPAH